MKIQWRGDEYDFFPRDIQIDHDRPNKNSTIYSPICGADTESVDMGDRYEPQCFQVSTPWGDELLYLPERAVGLEHFLDFLMMFEDNILLHKHSGAMVNRHLLMYFHNLEYDWLQLVKFHPVLLEMAKIGFGPAEPYEIMKMNGRKIILQKSALFVGNAPHFTIRIRKNQDTYFDIHFRDTWSYFPTSLEKASKDLKLPVMKKERADDLGRIDYRQFDPKDPKRIEFEDYSLTDAVATRLLAERIRELHDEQDMTKIRVSGPSFAISSLYHQMEQGDILKTGVWDEAIMQLIFDTYRGGRTGGIVHGRVENISVFDFHSSYPASMVSLPSFGEKTEYIPIEDLSPENVLYLINEVPSCFLRIDGIEHDAKYPGLITTKEDKLTPVYGEVKNLATTGIELAVAINSGTFELLKVHEMVVVADLEEDVELPFRKFAETAYQRKAEAEKGSAEYLSAKIELNSAYGKLIESRHETMIGARDGACMLPYAPGMEKPFADYYYQKYLDALGQGKSFFDDFDNFMDEVYATFEAIYNDERGPSDKDFSAVWRDDWERIRFGAMSISGRTYGKHVNPAAASLITATSRARLCAVMKALDAIYWDTDSVFVQDYDPATAAEKLKEASGWLPKGVLPLTIGEGLGELDLEIHGATGYLAGTKRYYLTDGENVKKAIHGIPALPYEKVEEVIQFLATDPEGAYSYESKTKPLKAKEAGSPERIGKFEAGLYEPMFQLDERLDWIQTATGWAGTIRPIDEERKKPKRKKKATAAKSMEEYLDKEKRKLKKETDPMSALRKQGPIRIPGPKDRYIGEYWGLPWQTRRKYFKREGLPIDEAAEGIGLDVRGLFDLLGGK